MIVNDPTSLRKILTECHVIAVVGMSANPSRPSFAVGKYLKESGYTVIPVNPGESDILGMKCYPSLVEIPQKIDIVDCFRKSEDIPALAKDAIAIGAKVLWMQQGVINQPAAEEAGNAGLEVVMDRCIKIDHAHLMA